MPGERIGSLASQLRLGGDLGVVGPAWALAVPRYAWVRLEHDPEMQLIATGENHGTVQLRSPNVVKRLLGKALDGQGDRIGHKATPKFKVIATLLQIRQQFQHCVTLLRGA